MALDLFSSVDFAFSKFSFFEKVSFVLSTLLISILFFKNKMYFRKNSIVSSIKNIIKQKFSKVLKFNVGKILLLISIFYFILLRKLSGLFPLVFGWTAHILIILQISIFLWLIIKLRRIEKNFISYFRHFTPQGVPLGLGLFLAKIELVSNLIRPLTLSLRLGIKITTGHILLALISVIGVRSTFSNLLLLPLVCFYFFFELFVMFIQAVVFTLLLSQYFEDKKT